MSFYDFHMDEGKFLFIQLDSLKIMKNGLSRVNVWAILK